MVVRPRKLRRVKRAWSRSQCRVSRAQSRHLRGRSSGSLYRALAGRYQGRAKDRCPGLSHRSLCHDARYHRSTGRRSRRRRFLQPGPGFQRRIDDRSQNSHQPLDGRELSIRQGDWKLCLSAGSGGWSSPREQEAKKKGLPPMQLFNLKDDRGEQKNLAETNTDQVNVLLELLEKEVSQGRCTEGEKFPTTERSRSFRKVFPCRRKSNDW